MHEAFRLPGIRYRLMGLTFLLLLLTVLSLIWLANWQAPSPRPNGPG